jgi:hypothetical protein
MNICWNDTCSERFLISASILESQLNCRISLGAWKENKNIGTKYKSSQDSLEYYKILRVNRNYAG